MVDLPCTKRQKISSAFYGNSYHQKRPRLYLETRDRGYRQKILVATVPPQGHIQVNCSHYKKNVTIPQGTATFSMRKRQEFHLISL